MKEFKNKNSYRNVLAAILKQKEPFCLTDIAIRLKNNDGITDEGLVLKVLNDMYEEGLVGYEKVTTEDRGNAGWAFVVK